MVHVVDEVVASFPQFTNNAFVTKLDWNIVSPPQTIINHFFKIGLKLNMNLKSIDSARLLSEKDNLDKLVQTEGI